jgi:hypothetical protein
VPGGGGGEILDFNNKITNKMIIGVCVLLIKHQLRQGIMDVEKRKNEERHRK